MKSRFARDGFHVLCRAPQGARGLKSYWFWLFPSNVCRAPQGARGLKYFLWESGSPLSQSRPARGAWVEIKQGKDYDFTTLVAPRKGRVGWITWMGQLIESRPARGAWVEMQILIVKPSLENRRAPQGARGLKSRKSNNCGLSCSRAPQGARGLKFSLSSRVQPLPRSRPARGAWVEIRKSLVAKAGTLSVAPRKGRVG